MADRLDALCVRENNGKSFWTKLGVAWPSKNGPGYIVRLDAIPAPMEGQFVIHLREPQVRDGNRSAPARSSAPADLDDESPF